MGFVFAYRHRRITASELTFLRELIAEHPGASRRALSKMVCEAWDWRQENGTLRDMVCRSLMLELHRAGLLELPPKRQSPPNNLARRKKPAPVEIDRSPIRGDLRALGPLRIEQVRRTPKERLLNGLLEMHHYLGYTQPVGEHLKHLVYASDRPIACFTWSSAARHLGPRDRFLGWSAQARRRNIRFIAYNSRFLILPWVEVPHLASHLLGRMVRALPEEWERVYGHPVWFAETFVHPAKFRGTCYRAANWVWLGRTTGRGKDDRTGKPNRPVKDELGHPLTKRFRELLGRLR